MFKKLSIKSNSIINSMELNGKAFARLELHKENILHNYRYFRSKINDSTKMLILIKANSYGHGAVEFAKTMEEAGANYFGIAHPWEGVELRQNGIKTPIIVLTAGVDAFEDIVNHYLEPSIPSLEALKLFNSYLEGRNIASYPVHIKLDTGMHRLGFMENELPALLDFLKSKPRVEVKSIFSHLAASDDPQHNEFTLGQIALYNKMAPQIDAALGYKPIHHILNSAGIERFSEYQMDMVRLGVGIYGISAVDQALVKPAASFKCDILQIKELVPEDGTVGYGRHGKIPQPIKIATIPVGYADGINRHLGRGNVKFMLNGKRVPTIGNICMDMCMIDITGIDAKVGDTVTLFGEEPSANEIANILGTIPYEVFTSVARRVRREK